MTLQNLALAFVAAGALALAACDGEQQSSSNASSDGPDLRNRETVAAATQTAWPSPSIEKIDDFDPMPTRDNLMVALDMSGSMDGGDCAGDYYSKAAAAKAALATWLQSVPEDANVGLAAFVDSDSRVYVPLGTNNRGTFMQTVNDLSPDGGTPLADIIDLAESELETQARHQRGYGSYRVVVITDGEHSSGQDPRPSVNRILSNAANPVEIHTIGFCVDDSHALNQPGQTFYVPASNPEQLAAGLESVLAESESFDAADFEALSDDAQSPAAN